MVEHTFNFFLTERDHLNGNATETRSWFGSWRQAMDAAWHWCSNAGYHVFDDVPESDTL